MKKIKRAQAYIDDLVVAEMMLNFRRDFNDVYANNVLCHGVGVGPMQSFIGYCIQQGYLETVEKDKNEN